MFQVTRIQGYTTKQQYKYWTHEHCSADVSNRREWYERSTALNLSAESSNQSSTFNNQHQDLEKLWQAAGHDVKDDQAVVDTVLQVRDKIFTLHDVLFGILMKCSYLSNCFKNWWYVYNYLLLFVWFNNSIDIYWELNARHKLLSW